MRLGFIYLGEDGRPRACRIMADAVEEADPDRMVPLDGATLRECGLEGHFILVARIDETKDALEMTVFAKFAIYDVTGWALREGMSPGEIEEFEGAPAWKWMRRMARGGGFGPLVEHAVEAARERGIDFVL